MLYSHTNEATILARTADKNVLHLSNYPYSCMVAVVVSLCVSLSIVRKRRRHEQVSL